MLLKFSRKEREEFWFYGIENFLVFIQMVIVFFFFLESEDITWLLVELGLSSIIALNEVRAKL